MVLFAFNGLATGSKLRTVGKDAARFLIFAVLLVMTVGMHERGAEVEDELSFAGRRHLSLVIAAHLNCPASRVTAAEAVRICYRAPGEVKVTALVFGEIDSENSMVSSLARVKARILTDGNGARARGLGITNSAQALLFSPNGKLLYNGSITASAERRENPGEEMVVEIIRGSDVNVVIAAPEGCSFEGRFCAHEHGLKTAGNL